MRTAWIACLGLIAASPVVAADPAPDAEIVALQQLQADAWNAHDIDRYAALFTADADVINVLGWHWQSREELRLKLGSGFASVFAHSRLTISEVSVEWLKTDIAVAQVRWTMTGALSPTGAAADTPEQGIQTQVLVRQDGHWLITDFQNTNSVPERAFPPQR
ncbi:MAG: SgcJ/EcaC family oxidoreductase [Croceibacterium sp.]